MTQPHDNRDELERYIDHALRDLGPRRAPRTLESRVLAELTHRAALPWWRKHFAHWPVAARAAFLIASAGSVQLAIVTVMWVFARIHVLGLATSIASWLRSAGRLTSSMINLSVSLAGLIPQWWLYTGAALCVLLYGTLLGLGAVGYRVLYADPSSRGLTQT
jgi:hypothetical protein